MLIDKPNRSVRVLSLQIVTDLPAGMSAKSFAQRPGLQACYRQSSRNTKPKILRY